MSFLGGVSVVLCTCEYSVIRTLLKPAVQPSLYCEDPALVF